MNWQFESMNGFMGGGMWLFWLILLVVMIMLFKLFVSPAKDTESAMDILKKRYAKGEITKEQFEEQKKSLQS
jgi:putative membrane protein